jgi:8-oxo-dGTP diphosphatase
VTAARPLIVVAAGVLRDAAGRVLITQRPPGSHAGGYWEFPGGKLHDGESPWAALCRELREELGIEASDGTALVDYAHDYPDRRVELHVWLVSAWSGEPHGREGQPLKWLPVSALAAAGLLPADLPVIDALLSLPR